MREPGFEPGLEARKAKQTEIKVVEEKYRIISKKDLKEYIDEWLSKYKRMAI